jgi:predicted TIM-barrel fold metal-dependent hydrolase
VTGGGGPGVPPPIIDFPHETTRCAVNLIISNVVRDFPRVKIILSHGGGTLPFVARRVADLMADSGLLGKLGKTMERFLDEAKSFYFDLALTGYEESMALVLSFAKEGHVLYGSDFPFARDRAVAGQLSTVKGWRDEKVRESVERGAAERLFPRLVQQ